MKELTIEKFNEIPHGKVFAQGEIIDSPEGLNMMNTGKTLKWIAKKGMANDWTIYSHWSTSTYDFVRIQGQKVYDKNNIQNVVPCTDKVMNRYRF